MTSFIESTMIPNLPSQIRRPTRVTARNRNKVFKDSFRARCRCKGLRGTCQDERYPARGRQGDH
eukprot:8967808-Pyramimonas_sp.AAC.1